MKRLTPREAIKLVRERRGWTQEDFAREVGVCLFTVNRWESGAIKAPSRLAFRVLDKLFKKEGIDVEKPVRKR